MLIKLYNKNNSQKELDRIVQVLNEGGIIIYPTDTTYAIGCHALKERPIERICQIKKMDSKKKPLSIVCPDLSTISLYAKVDNTTFKLMKQLLPGPYTFILNSSSKLPKIFKNRKEVGIRVPDHDVLREICQLLEAPLLTTSLPKEEEEDWEYITNPELIEEKFGSQVDLVLDGGIGGIEPSTIIDCTEGSPELIRQGKGEWIE